MEMSHILQSVYALPEHNIYIALFCPSGSTADTEFKTTNEPRFQLKPKPVKSCRFCNLTMSRRQADESTSPLWPLHVILPVVLSLSPQATVYNSLPSLLRMPFKACRSRHCDCSHAQMELWISPALSLISSNLSFGRHPFLRMRQACVAPIRVHCQPSLHPLSQLTFQLQRTVAMVTVTVRFWDSQSLSVIQNNLSPSWFFLFLSEEKSSHLPANERVSREETLLSFWASMEAHST